MSGHSKWATIKHKKAATDAKRGQMFTKLIKEITVAARNGGNPDTNPRLRSAIDRGKEASMPADNIDRAIKKGTGALEGVSYEDITLEGYGPGGVAIYVEGLSDNKNRTTSDVRTIFSKNGGNMAGAGSYGVKTPPADFYKVKKALEDRKIKTESAEVTMIPKSTVKVAGDEAKKVINLVNSIEEHDDVQNVYANFDIPDDLLKE
ncbi:MAG: YebC/PmpR family DNA-binding transcriptional regulator [Candidatus Omnitrophica bacterium]|nr:YebC/PmpR family DNA-binding transcriptional regulator [Candidatus Omnitrophota bacterium]